MTTPGPVHHGSVRGVRTFRLTRDGHLAPVTDRTPWSPGLNTAVCDRRSLRGPLPPAHTAPAPGCGCGLWACGNTQALREAGVLGVSRVLAVVAAHGQLLPATRGFRAQHARIEALWLSPRIPAARRQAVARAYPDAALYSTRRAMLAEHPPTQLAAYQLPAIPRRAALVAQLAGLAVWPLLVAALWLTTPAPTATAATHLVPDATAQVVAASLALFGHLAIATTTLLLASHTRWWRYSLLTLIPQTVLLAAGQLAFDDATTWAQLGMAAIATAVMHTAAAGLAAWRLHALDTDQHH